jgi:hypothetical protein
MKMNKIRLLFIMFIFLGVVISGCTQPKMTKAPYESVITETSSVKITSDETLSEPSSIPATSDLSSLLLSGTLSSNITLSKAPTKVPKKIIMKIGDYVQMGKYYDEPILWRCVDIDANGPLMLADRILTIKSFDAAGAHTYLDGTPQADYSNYRANGGSNLWETSNMRSWLNSTATAGNVTWPDGCPPTESAVEGGYNDYATEKGFLADGNFTATERNAIRSVTQKSILNGIDANKLKEGGIVLHLTDYSILSVIQNYDVAYYYNVTDKMFLLDINQLSKVYQKMDTLGNNYYRGKPTQRAVDNSDYKDPSLLNTSSYWHNCLRTPFADSGNPDSVRYVNSDGSAKYNVAYAPYLGTRPAFYINLSSAFYISGNGTASSPYIVE